MLSCLGVCCCHKFVKCSRRQRLDSGQNRLESLEKMELSAVGDRVFAAEAILKRRVRKVGAGFGPLFGCVAAEG